VADEEGLAVVELSETGKLVVRAFRGGRVGGPVPLAAPGPTLVALRPASQLRGRVLSPDGARVAGFSLDVSVPRDDASAGRGTRRGGRVKGSGGGLAPRQLQFAGDRFELADVPSGPVRLQVQTQSGRVGRVDLVLEAGEARDVDVIVEPGATADGPADAPR
jgi:hypothetical protein